MLILPALGVKRANSNYVFITDNETPARECISSIVSNTLHNISAVLATIDNIPARSDFMLCPHNLGYIYNQSYTRL